MKPRIFCYKTKTGLLFIVRDGIVINVFTHWRSEIKWRKQFCHVVMHILAPQRGHPFNYTHNLTFMKPPRTSPPNYSVFC